MSTESKIFDESALSNHGGGDVGDVAVSIQQEKHTSAVSPEYNPIPRHIHEEEQEYGGSSRVDVAIEGEAMTAMAEEHTRTHTSWRLLLLPPHGLSPFEQACEEAISVAKPVCVSLVVVVGYVAGLSLGNAGAPPFVHLMPRVDKPSDAAEQLFYHGLINALFIMSLVVACTLLFVVLFRYRLRFILYGTLAISYAVIIGVFFSFVLLRLLEMANIPTDYFTFSLVIYNLSVVGAIVICWEQLSLLTHMKFLLNGYLLAMSISLTLPFSCFSEWTLWLVLLLLVFWDIFAVLAPCGPLRYVMEVATNRRLMGEAFDIPPGMLYKTRKFQIGTGDFIFYGTLVGRAATADYVTFVACFTAILAGLFITVFFTFQSKRLLPALPLALSMSIVTYFIFKYMSSEYVSFLTEGAVHI